jgi:two-component system cell cycle sensor histidine kinase/response regulator CckA
MPKKKAFRILHIEDNVMDQQLVGDMLSGQKAAGYALDTAATLAQGIELLEAGAYDLLLLDLNLPDSQATTTLERIVSVQNVPAIVVVSGIDDEATAMESLEKGAQDYLLKGHFDEEVLVRSMRYAAYRKHTEESLRRNQETLEHEVEAQTRALADANRELKSSAEQYRDLFYSSIEALFTLDPQGNLTRVNEVFTELTGYSQEEAIAQSFRKGMDDRDADYLFGVYREMHRSKGHVRNLEFTLIRKDGKKRNVEVSANLLYKDGAFAGFQGAIRDITDRRAAEKALRESEEKYRQVVENAREAIIVFVDGIVVYANPMTERITDYSADELKGKTLEELAHPEDHEALKRETTRKIEGDHTVYPSEYRYIKKTGDVGWYEAIAVPVTWEGKPGLITFAREITERKKLEEQFLRAQKMDAIGAMAGGIAHNFNNILVGIMGYSEYLLGNKDKNHPEYKALKTIFDGTVRASQLTRELLNVTRAGEYRLVTGNLNDTVERSLPLIAGAFDKSIDIKTVLAEDLPVFEVNDSQMQQCLLNLCINARDAMPDGGTLLIETRQEYLDADFVRTHIGSHEGEYLILSVSDTGIGMTREVKDHLFEPFFTTKLDKGGTGMGLATVYGTVKKHGGFITVYSETGQGTTFNLYLPITRVAAKDEKVAIIRDRKEGHETILIIDDEQAVRNVWAEYLVRKGYRVLLAENGREGISLFRKNPGAVDLVILDVIMPKMGGKDTLAALKDLDPGVRVLITSGYRLKDKVGEIDLKDVEGFIQKPGTLKEFSEKIGSILDRDRAKRA